MNKAINTHQIVFDFPTRVIKDGNGNFIPITRRLYGLINSRYSAHGNIPACRIYYQVGKEYIELVDRFDIFVKDKRNA